MRKIIIALTTIITVAAVGMTTTFALNSMNDIKIEASEATAIPEIKITEKQSAQTNEKTETVEIEKTATKDTTSSPTEEVPTVQKTETAEPNNEQTAPAEIICDYCGGADGHHYEDANGDGICDHYSGSHNGGYGTHHRYYSDENRDGICDNYGNGGYGQGGGYGHHGRHHR